MGVFNGAFPVLPGQEDAARSFAKEVLGPRHDEFVAQETEWGITDEVWTLQPTPMGTLMLVYFVGDVEKAFTDLATGTSDFLTWLRAQVQAITGVDLAQPPEGAPPETLLEWKP